MRDEEEWIEGGKRQWTEGFTWMRMLVNVQKGNRTWRERKALHEDDAIEHEQLYRVSKKFRFPDLGQRGSK